MLSAPAALPRGAFLWNGGETPPRAHFDIDLSIVKFSNRRSMSAHPAQADIVTVTGWTARRCTLATAVLELPYMTTVVALPPHPGYPKRSPLDM